MKMLGEFIFLAFYIIFYGHFEHDHTLADGIQETIDLLFQHLSSFKKYSHNRKLLFVPANYYAIDNNN